MKRNTFSKALKHLKSTELDEKIQRLNEAPTNSTSGVYSLNDPGFRLGGVDEYDPERVFYPDVDGNWPAGIPGTPGADTYTRPAGFWSGGTDWDTVHVSDLSQAYLDVDATGKNTSSLIESDGTVKTPLPPNSRNFILGPLVDGYVPNHGYDDFTNIGYLQKDTRQFVLLASIPGHWDSNLRPSGFAPRQWDGSTITIYNANFTLAMAEWFRDKITSNNYTENVPYFYSGGVPQLPQSPADCPKCPPNMKGGNGAGGAGAGWGSGGNSGQGSKQGNPKKGGPGDANLWGLNAKTGKKEKLSAKDYAAYKAGGGDAASKKGKSIKEIIAQGQKNLGQDKSPLNKFWDSIKGFKNNMDSLKSNASRWMADTISKFSGVSPQTITSIGNGIAKALQPLANITGKGLGGAVQLGFHGTSQAAADRILAPVSNLFTGKSGIAGFKPGSTQNIYRTSNVFAAPSGGTQAKGGMIPQVAQEFSRRGGDAGRGAISRAFSPQSTKSGAIIPTVLPKGSGPGMTIPGTKYAEISAPASKATKGTELANRVLSGSYANSAKAQQLIATGKTTASISGARGLAVTLGKAAGPAAAALVVADVGLRGASAAKNYSKGDYANAGLDAAGALLGGLTIVPGPIGWGALAAQVALDGGRALLQREGYIMEEYLIEEQMNNYAQYYQDMTKLLAQALRSGLSEIGEISDSENQFISNIENGRISPEDGIAIQSILKKIQSSASLENNNLNMEVQESILLPESRQRILREIKQPVKVEESQPQKLKKYRPNFAGRYTAQNTPDVTASPESDAMVKAKNAAGQTWRTKDKHWSRYESTERMNIIFDNVGHGSQYWDQIVDKNQLKKVVRDREVQEHLNIIAHEKAMLREDPFYESPFRKEIQEQETLQVDKDPLFRKVKNRLNSVIDYPDKPSKLGYPDAPPPEMMNGFHPEYGQKADYYNALDPHSAEAMPSTGNPEIDAKVRRAKTLKRVLGKKA